MTKFVSDPKKDRTACRFSVPSGFQGPALDGQYPESLSPPSSSPETLEGCRRSFQDARPRGRGLRGIPDHRLRNILSHLPCGICITTGGPGAGNAHWIRVLTAAIQSKGTQVCSGTVLTWATHEQSMYILKIDMPIDENPNRIFKLYKSLRLQEFAVRLYGMAL